MKTAEEFTITFKTPFDTRRVLLKEMTYECLTEYEYIEKLKEKVNVD